MTHIAKTSNKPTRTRARRPRGSLLLLVVASLLFMLLLGLAYMEVAKQDRIATRNLHVRRDLDLQMRAVVDLISSRLKQDLAIDDSGTDSDSTDDRFFTFDHGDGIEPYDYAYFVDTSTPEVDPWLASTAPNGSNWPQISLLGANYAPGGTTQEITARDVSHSSIVGKAITDTPDADADGDQITDAKWEEAVIHRLHGVQYWMAVRIVDNSGKVNMNTATRIANSSGAYDTTATGTNAPRWFYPSDIDAAFFVRSYGTSGTFQTELDNALTYRGATSASWTDRAAYWLNGPSLYNNLPAGINGFPNPNSVIDHSDEMELAHRNGLNDPTIDAQIEDTTDGMPTFLREADTEIIWSSPTGISGVGEFFTKNPRNLITTISGHSIITKALTGDAGPTFKQDINRRTAAELSAIIKQVIDLGTFTRPTGFASNQEYADALACCIIDYYDDDNHITTHNGQYGIEALPYIAETYVQTPMIKSADDGTTTGTWTQNGGFEWVIEIRNPFKRPIDLQGVKIKLDGVPAAGVLLTSFPGVPNTMNPDQVLYLFSAGSPNILADMGVTVGASDIAVPAALIWPGTAGEWGGFYVDMTAPQDGTPATDVLYHAAWAIYGTTSWGVSYPDGANGAINATGYRQRGRIGNGNGINTMLVKDNQYVNTVNNQWNGHDDAAYDDLGEANKGKGVGDVMDATLNQIVMSGGPAGTGGYDQITQIGELAHIAAIPRATNDHASALAQNADYGTAPNNLISNFMLNFGSGNVAGAGDLAVPHGVLLMERLTTLSPREDLDSTPAPVDNDGDGVANAADPDEVFVPGRINVNTAPEKVLRNALPINGTGLQERLAKAIARYRDHLERPANHRGTRGIAFMGEIYNVFNGNITNVPDWSWGDTTVNPYVDTRGGAKWLGDTRDMNSTVIDFTSNPDPSTADGIADDFEEASIITRWLGQVCSTRSDIFTAHILIRGFRDTPPTEPFVERRAVVIFDRSSVIDATRRVKILGIRTY